LPYFKFNLGLQTIPDKKQPTQHIKQSLPDYISQDIEPVSSHYDLNSLSFEQTYSHDPSYSLEQVYPFEETFNTNSTYKWLNLLINPQHLRDNPLQLFVPNQLIPFRINQTVTTPLATPDTNNLLNKRYWNKIIRETNYNPIIKLPNWKLFNYNANVWQITYLNDDKVRHISLLANTLGTCWLIALINNYAVLPNIVLDQIINAHSGDSMRYLAFIFVQAVREVREDNNCNKYIGWSTYYELILDFFKKHYIQFYYILSTMLINSSTELTHHNELRSNETYQHIFDKMWKEFDELDGSIDLEVEHSNKLSVCMKMLLNWIEWFG